MSLSIQSGAPRLGPQATSSSSAAEEKKQQKKLGRGSGQRRVSDIKEKGRKRKERDRRVRVLSKGDVEQNNKHRRFHRREEYAFLRSFLSGGRLPVPARPDVRTCIEAFARDLAIASPEMYSNLYPDAGHQAVTQTSAEQGGAVGAARLNRDLMTDAGAISPQELGSMIAWSRSCRGSYLADSH
ncbi:MAG: hypothetical protein OXC07_03740 [Kistimonas sp.]|nr:hypothetical protein [Kistimonas sp.]